MRAPDFEAFLQQTMGLGAASIGSPAVARAVRSRMVACNVETQQAYWDHLQGTAGEAQELIEAVVVGETWFFRDREAFGAMSGFLKKKYAKARSGEVRRLLSVPCATGEEPYSMVMALLDAGIPPDSFRVDAVDISIRALERAQDGTYGRNSFRGEDLTFRDRHFMPVTGGHRISDAVSRHVRFTKGNVFDPGFLAAAEEYDVVFCRNLLIYFDMPEQHRAIAVLKRLLLPEGQLFVGPSETTLLLSCGFVPARIPLAFAFHAERDVSSAPPKASRHIRSFAAPMAAPSVRELPASVSAPPPPPPDSPKSAAKPDIEDIRRLADQGHLAEAAHACEEHIRVYGASAPALYLLALIRDSAGSYQEAADHYRKTLYLDPHHKEALAHLSFLLEKQGDVAAARILHGRLDRLERGMER